MMVVQMQIEVFGTSGGSYVMKVVGRKKEP